MKYIKKLDISRYIIVILAVIFVVVLMSLIGNNSNEPEQNTEEEVQIPLIIDTKEFLSYDNGTMQITVYYESGQGITELDFIFENEKKEVKKLRKNNINQKLNETKVYRFNKIEVGLNNVTSVAVVPIYNSNKGINSTINVKKIVLSNKHPYCHLSNGIQNTLFNNSIILYMNFDNNTKDISGNSNDGILFGNASVSPSGGKKKGAVILDGKGDYIQIPSFDKNFTGMTITAWINGKGTGKSTGIILSRDSTQTMGINYREGTGEIGYHWNNNSASTWNYASNLDIPVNQWTFVVLSIESEKATLYISNSSGLFNSTNSIKHYPQLSNSVWRIGSDSFTTDRYFNGTVDEVMIFNRSLKYEEIKGLYDCYSL